MTARFGPQLRCDPEARRDAWYDQGITVVSIPDDVFEKGEKAAKRLKMSRSELCAKALEAYVDAHTPDAITESWNAMLAEMAPDEKRT
jgi:metal-responsive CopG/Arc/MetJ family transcriptional regulator